MEKEQSRKLNYLKEYALNTESGNGSGIVLFIVFMPQPFPLNVIKGIIKAVLFIPANW